MAIKYIVMYCLSNNYTSQRLLKRLNKGLTIIVLGSKFCSNS
jgi:hypothetical protein